MSNLEKELKGVAKELGGGKGHGHGKKKSHKKSSGSSLEKKAKRLLK